MADFITLYKYNTAKLNEAIVVPNGRVNDTDTSLTFIGKNAPSFGVAVNQDFLYLLENFANSTPPLHPTEGQVWYDSSNDALTGKKLKVFDSTVWKPINGIWQQDGDPDTPERGDIWVNTAKSQVFIRTGLAGTGTNWTLVGPAYSNVLKTGSYADEIYDNVGAKHRVIKNYIDDQVIEVISTTAFFPQPPIAGFGDGLHAGVNLSSTYNGKLNATAATADALNLADGSTVTGDSLVKTNVDSTINATLNVKTVQIGQSSSNGTTTPWSISQNSNGYQADFKNPVAGGTFVFQVTTSELKNALAVNMVKVTGDGVGINLVGNNNPSTALDVNGTARATVFTATTAIYSSGSVFVSQNLSVGNTANLANTYSTGTIYVGTTYETTPGGRSLLLPQTTGTYAPNIGSSVKKFGSIYAQNFVGNVIGDVTGGSSKLTNSSTWSISGQISASGFLFQGLAGNYTFDAELTPAAINSQTAATSVGASDTLLIAKPSDPTQLYRVTRNDFVKDIKPSTLPYLVPTGAIMPFAGPAKNVPAGWLLCDGSLVDQGNFNDLFNVIKYTYGKGSVPSQFKIPDLRSRFPMGYDDMTNGATVNGQSVLVPAAPTDPAFRTSNLSPSYAESYELGITGPVVGQFDAVGASGVTMEYTTTTNATIDTALHFHALNYIIKT